MDNHLKNCEKIYSESGAGSVYDYAAANNLSFAVCTPCSADTPTADGACAICGTLKTKEDTAPHARYYSISGIVELENFHAEIKDDELQNESDFFASAEAQTGNEVSPGDIITVTYIDSSATKATVYAYIINENFMGSYDVSFYGKRTHAF